MADHGFTPRHRRRRENGVARTIFDEARRAGLVQRHLRKLQHLAARAPTAEPGAGLSSSDPSAAGATAATGPPLTDRAAASPHPAASEAA